MVEQINAGKINLVIVPAFQSLAGKCCLVSRINTIIGKARLIVLENTHLSNLDPDCYDFFKDLVTSLTDAQKTGRSIESQNQGKGNCGAPEREVTEEQVRQFKDMKNRGLKISEIMAKLQITDHHVRKIRRTIKAQSKRNRF